MMLSSEISYLEDITKPKLIDVIPVSTLVDQVKRGHPMVTEYRTLLDQLYQIDKNKDPGEFKKHKTKTDRFKKTLPAYAVAGIFGNGVTNQQFKSSSGLFLVDIDKLENSEEVNKVKQTLARIPSVAFTFISPGALGLKAAFRICPTLIRNDKNFYTAFKVIEAWLTDEFTIEIDASCKDVRRLCFVSHDPDIYVNEQAERIDFMGLKERYRTAAKLGSSPSPKPRSTELLELPQATNTGWTPNYVKAAIADELSKLELTTEGDRNNQLNKSAFQLFALVEKSGHGCLDHLEDKVRRSAQAIGLDDSEIDATLKSAREARFKSTRQPPQPKQVDINPEIIERAERLAKFIDKKINEQFKDSLEDQEYAHPEVIAAILASTFWSGQKSKGLMLNISGDNIIQFVEKDILTQCQMIHGSFCDTEAINTRFNPHGYKLDAVTNKELNSILSIPSTYLINHLKSHNHRDNMVISTDMFINRSMMDIKRDTVTVKFKHPPFETRLPVFEIDPVIINDYKEHFTRLDLFIDFIVQSRFASDRKYAYLWIKADSDWGKGFLISTISSEDHNTGAVTKLSVKEVEKMFEGGPVSKSLPDFKRSIVLHLDEFKTVKSELKQLENEIPVSPKNQLQFTTKVFAKIFTSAEGVPALIGDSGIEDQFANRFSLFEEQGMLSKRPVFIERGKEAYMNNVQSYVCHQLNSRIAQMKAMGASASADHGNRWLERFIKDHGISNYVERFSEGLPDLAEDFLEWIYTEDNSTSDLITTNLIFSKNKHSSHFDYYLKAPKFVWDKYVEISGQFSFSEQAAIKRKYEDIFKLISKDGSKRPETKHISEKGKHKVIQLKPKPYSTCGTRGHQPWAPCLNEDF